MTKQITSIEELEPGDEVVVEYRSATVRAVAEQGGTKRGLLVGQLLSIRYADGSPVPGVTLVSATRPAPPLPTEPQSIIRIKSLRPAFLRQDTRGYVAICASGGCWHAFSPDGARKVFDSSDIAEWEPYGG